MRRPRSLTGPTWLVAVGLLVGLICQCHLLQVAIVVPTTDHCASEGEGPAQVCCTAHAGEVAVSTSIISGSSTMALAVLDTYWLRPPSIPSDPGSESVHPPPQSFELLHQICRLLI